MKIYRSESGTICFVSTSLFANVLPQLIHFVLATQAIPQSNKTGKGVSNYNSKGHSRSRWTPATALAAAATDPRRSAENTAVATGH